MISIHKNTLNDLELPAVLLQISEYCITSLGEKAVLKTVPFNTKEDIRYALNQTNEYLSSFENDNRIPNHGFDAINSELKQLSIENTFLEVESFRKIAALSATSNTLIKFFKKFKDYYPTLHHEASQIEITDVIVKAIENVIDKHGQIKHDASPELAVLRQAISKLRKQINGSFKKALSGYKAQDFLDDILESVIENRRVLAVKAMYRRKVKGSILGSSKTGSIVYIEPENTLKAQRELNNVLFEEREELIRILKALTDVIRTQKALLKLYQSFLTHLDVLYAKAKYARSIGAVLPNLSDKKVLDIKDAFHPLLLRSNNKKGEKTFPQTLELDENHRIIVISGPNAGGKSITLKTVGLLQVMLQSGLLVPVHERSTFSIFNRIISDIGDNQSIENHLSTYSYRLKQMNYFLKKCNDKTLFLIDEFGTGSDPELGGALAEAFLEIFYEREAFGIITTHYSNLKLLANELPYMQNANMLFDERSLQPIFKLVVGQAGSSFTFEVAQKNGIPYSLINKAKKKIERGKIRFDRTIAKLQKERSKLEKTERSLKANEQKKIAEADKLEGINARVQAKLESYQELYDANQRLIYLGQKVDKAAEIYFNNKRKRDLLAELFRIVQIENSKRKTITPKEKKVKQAKEIKVKREVKKQVEVIRKKKKAAKKKEIKTPKPRPNFKIGDRVRLEDGRAIGTIDKIEKNKAIVNYGIFTTNVSVEALELVETSKS